MAVWDRASIIFFFSSRRRHTRCSRDWSSDVCSSDLSPNSGRRIHGLHGLHPRGAAGAARLFRHSRAETGAEVEAQPAGGGLRRLQISGVGPKLPPLNGSASYAKGTGGKIKKGTHSPKPPTGGTA